MSFLFNQKFLHTYETLKNDLVIAMVIVSPNWKDLFELMCDASAFSIGLVL